MHPKRTVLTLAAAVLALFFVACGDDSSDNAPAATDASQTVNVEMVDIAFKPTQLTAAKGETVRFVFTNSGKVEHEAFVGTPAEQRDHDKDMTAGSKSGGHDMGSMGGGSETGVTVDPGKTGEFTTRFDDAGTIEIGCRVPGHYAAGMKITVVVG